MGRHLVAACFCFAVLAGGARADALRIGTAGDYKPLTWYDARTGTFSGTDIDLIRAFAADEGRAVVFVKTTWPQLMADLLAGRFDAAIGGISRTPQRSREALLSVTIARSGKVALVRCGDEARYGSLAAIDRTSVTVVENRGGTNEKFALGRIAHAVLVIVPDNRLPFVYLKEGRADVMFTDSIEAVYRQRTSDGALCAVHPDAPYTQDDKVAMFRKDQTALRARFDAWFKKRRPEP